MNDRGITQEELSEMTGISKSTLAKILSGNSKNPTLQNVTAISHALGISLDAFERDETAAEGDELSEYLEELRTRPEMKMLFSLTKHATREDVEKAVKIIETILGKN